MQRITIAYGALLIGLGLSGYFGSGRVSITALIPVFFGVPIVILGIVARNEKLRKHAMHGTVLLALLGFFGSARGLSGAVVFLGGGQLERPGAAIAQLVMAFLSLIYIGIAIRSFVSARRNR